jgi:hypothetical protein
MNENPVIIFLLAFLFFLATCVKKVDALHGLWK